MTYLELDKLWTQFKYHALMNVLVGKPTCMSFQPENKFQARNSFPAGDHDHDHDVPKSSNK